MKVAMIPVNFFVGSLGKCSCCFFSAEADLIISNFALSSAFRNVLVGNLATIRSPSIESIAYGGICLQKTSLGRASVAIDIKGASFRVEFSRLKGRHLSAGEGQSRQLARLDENITRSYRD
jgi:hypothetical protein